MSFSDTANARKFASIAEVAAAQAKLSADKLENAPDYAEQAAASAAAAASSAFVAVSAESVVNNLAISASESATSAAASAATAGNAAAAAVGQCLRVPEGESVDVLPDAADRLNSFLAFDASGNVTLLSQDDVAILDSEGKVPVSMIPAIALSQPFVVSSQAAMLALDAQTGDVAKRTDLGYSFILSAEPASTLSNWVQLNDDVLAQLGLSSGAAQIGALDDSGGSTNVQAALGLKLSSASLALPDGFKFIGKVATISALRSTEPTQDKQWVNVATYWTDSLTPQGTYWHDAADTTSADNGGTIIVTAGGKRWKFNGDPTVETYGAYGDGTHDDTSAIIQTLAVEQLTIGEGGAYLLASGSIQPTMQRQVIKWGKNTRLIRQRTSSERTAGTIVCIYDYTLSYREHCEIYGGVCAAASGDEGFVDGIHSAPTVYVATNHFTGTTFERSLRKCIYANTILTKFSFCLFGIGGTQGASHMHYHQNGQPLVGSNLTSNFNTFEFCRFFNASGVDYASDVGDGFMINYIACDFETNNAAIATVNNKGAYLLTFEFSWAERNAGTSFLRCSMDTTGTTQGPLNQVFRNCWIKLDGTGNTCITNSTTQNFNVSYERCAGSSYSGKVLTKITGVADDYTTYQSVQGCRFVGWSKQDDNDYMFGKLSTNTLSLKDTAGAINSLITGTSSRLIMRHATGVSIQDMSGNVIGEILTTATGTQFRGKSQSGVSMKLQPPTDGNPAAAQWTVV